MSVATSIPCMRLPATTSSSSSCCSSSSSCFNLRLPHTTKPTISFTVRSSQTEGPIRRPSPTPPVKEPSLNTPPSFSTPPSPSTPPSLQQPSSPASSSPPPIPKPVEDNSAVTLEFQRAKAKELQDYFKQKKLEKAAQGPAFGFVPKNEINNGRWAMFGFAVGMLTEYATGSDFVDQVKLMLSNLGIVDLD